jgi:hypothetical protein
MDAIKYVATLFFLIITASLCSAQQSRINGQQKIVLPATTIRFDSLLSIVSRQTGAKFSLNTSKFPPSRLIHLPKGPMPVTQLLAAIREDTGIYYTMLGDHIIFIDNPPRKSHPQPARKSTAAKGTKEKSAAEKLLLKKLSANKVAVPATAQVSLDLQAIPTIYFVRDTLLTSAAVIHADSGNLAAAPVIQRDSIKKEDSVKTAFVPGINSDPIKKTDSLKTPFGRSTTKEINLPPFTSADGAYHQRLRFVGCQPDPWLSWGWGSKKEDTLIHKTVAIKGTDSTDKAEQPATITKANTPVVATNKKTQQPETTTASASPDEKIKQTSITTGKTSLAKSILQNTFSNRYQKPGGQGVRGSRVQGPFSLLVNVGVTADEVYYANPTIQIGLPFLYGIASYSTNFNLIGFRAGVGIAARLSNDWRLHLQGTTGSQSQLFSFSDTIGHSVQGTLKSQLLKFSLVGERYVGEHLRLQAGIVLSNQRVQYNTNDGVPLSALNMDKVYQQINIIHAPYTITNYNGYGQNTKTWIGFQVGIFYNINFNRRR